MTTELSEADVRLVLGRFIEAFEQGDVESMQAMFATDSLTFPRSIMSASASASIDSRDYRRVTGLDPQMLAVVERARASASQPPYLRVEPQDLDIRILGDAALATFHLVDGQNLGRRTLVLSKQDGVWKILHLHASNVVMD